MPQTADRVLETSASTGTGNFTLGGPTTNYQSFNVAFGTGSKFWYSIVGSTAWEIGIGYLSDSTTLIRDKVVESSNSDNLVDFAAGTKQVFCTQPASSVRLGTRGRGYASTRGMDLM